LWSVLVLAGNIGMTKRDSEKEPSKDRRESFSTSRPVTPAPTLTCPLCDGALQYRQTIYGGDQPPERWDQYDCAKCGSFEYRHRTQELRRIE
jgi:hypothetical protein